VVITVREEWDQEQQHAFDELKVEKTLFVHASTTRVGPHKVYLRRLSK